MYEAAEDTEYLGHYQKFGGHIAQLDVLLSDIESYLDQVESSVTQFNDIALSMEHFMAVGGSTSLEVETKWRKYAQIMRDLLRNALTEHQGAVRRHVLRPVQELYQLQQKPQRLIEKRKKRRLDSLRYAAIGAKGGKPDAKTKEQHEQFHALNETLKEELPRLYELTARLGRYCLVRFFELQTRWQQTWSLKLAPLLDGQRLPKDSAELFRAFSSDYKYADAQVLALGVCNGSTLADTANFLSPTTTVAGEESSSHRGSSISQNTMSIGGGTSPASLQNETIFQRSSGSHFPPAFNGATPYAQVNSTCSAQSRASSGYSLNRTPFTPSLSQPARPLYTTIPPASYTPRVLSLNPRSGVTASEWRLGADQVASQRPSSRSTYHSTKPQPETHSPTGARHSGMFSSAMPITSDDVSEPSRSARRRMATRESLQLAEGERQVLFTAASLFPFNVDPSRTEAGFPYLTYVAGEVSHL